MPEQLTKHPEVTLQVLRSAGAQCGQGAAQDILVSCPAARFCKLPGGEVCVYGLADAGRMTQIAPAEWQALAAGGVPAPTAGTPVSVGPLALALLAGLAIGVLVARFRRAGGG
jgi:uncharacterized protein YneF (UPF0154 family)